MDGWYSPRLFEAACGRLVDYFDGCFASLQLDVMLSGWSETRLRTVGRGREDEVGTWTCKDTCALGGMDVVG